MANLAARSAFTALKTRQTKNFSVEPRDNVVLVSIAPFRNQLPHVQQALKSAYGASLPDNGRWSDGQAIRFMWGGDGVWYAVSDRTTGRDLERDLKKVLGGSAAVTDHSDGRAVARVGGARARDILAKGIPLDLHKSVFKTGQVAITHASHIGIILWQADEAPSYDIAMFRSFADSFATWFNHSAHEFE